MNFKNKNKAGGFTISDFNTYYKATIIKRVWYWHTSTNVNQWNIFEGPILNPNIYG